MIVHVFPLKSKHLFVGILSCRLDHDTVPHQKGLAMHTLFVNAAYRKGSRTLRLARSYLEETSCEVSELDLGNLDLIPLDAQRLARYNAAVAAQSYDDPLFDVARQFAAADEIVIAAPYWNNSIPAALHTYLELACSQGVTFDIQDDGTYVGLCQARRLVFITTAGGEIPRHNHAFGYVESLARDFWHIPEVICYQAEGLDAVGCDVEARLQATCAAICAKGEHR